ncbi:MAG: hypothetical protein WD960_09955 [Gemmatimonadota bacterium]
MSTAALSRFTPTLAVAIAVLLTACESSVSGPEANLDPLPTALQNLENSLTGEEIEANSSFDAPSTNELNEAKMAPGHEGKDAPFVRFEEVGLLEVTLAFVNNTNSLVYFEYRVDGETVGSTPHPNPSLGHDVIHPGVSVDGRGIAEPVTTIRTFQANETVEIRLALGGERDWDFDWTTFYVATSPENRDQCKDGVWEDLGFRNQGQCIRFVETGRDSR